MPAQPLLLSRSMATHTKSPTHHHLLTLPCRVNWHLTYRWQPEGPSRGVGAVPGMVSRELVPSWGFSLPISQMGMYGVDSEVLRTLRL